jgi:hypothetical protein
MKTPTLIILSLLITCLVHAQQSPSADAISGVKGAKQEAVQSIKKIAPPTVVPVTPPPPTGVTQPVPPPPPAAQAMNKVEGVKPPPPPPPPQAVNKVDGIQATPPNTVKGVPPPPAAAISTIRAVQGVQGIIAPRQLNLEAALVLKEDAKGTPATPGAEGGKGKAAAAALLNGPKGLVPAPPVPNGDARGALQEFEKLDKPGS